MQTEAWAFAIVVYNMHAVARSYALKSFIDFVIYYSAQCNGQS